jgi:DNA polymerase-1
MLLYGMTAHNFASRFNMSMTEAQEFVDAFKNGLPTLFTWINSLEKLGERQGYVTTMFGRPRRVKSWFDTGDWSWVNFAKRTCVNSAVQGTGADILKIVMIRLFNTFYTTERPLTSLIRFKNTIHDEINYQIIKDKEHDYKAFKTILKQVMKLMRVKLPEWPFPMEIGLSIGNRWGQSVDFNFDSSSLEVLGPKGDLASDKDILDGLGIKINKAKEEKLKEQELDPNMIIEY